MFSTVKQCVEKAPPASFTVQFEVAHTVPECDPTSTDSLKVLCAKKKDGTASLRFALRVKDASAEMDILCLDRPAEKLLGATAHDITTNEPDRCGEALQSLQDILSPGSICEGKVRSILGKDGKVYFILQSMFCITADSI